MDKRAFVFDFDGVMIDDEKLWEEAKKDLFVQIYGKEIAKKLNKTLGKNIEAIDQKARELGSSVPMPTVFKAYETYAKSIYHKAPLTDGIDTLIDLLHKETYVIGVVSASPRDWIDIVFRRVTWSNYINETISLHDRADLAHKPEPDGYVEMIKLLSVQPTHTVVLEDSNDGIISAKKAGAYVIGLHQNLPEGYALTGADRVVGHISELNDFIVTFGI